MKTTKLILTFIVILAGVIGVFYLTMGPTLEPIKPPIIDKYETYRKQIESEWEQRGDWDRDLFLSHTDMVKQLSVTMNTEQLKGLITSITVGIVDEKIFAEWQLPTCRRSTINRYISAVNTICKNDKNAKENRRVQEIRKVNNKYQQAIKLIEQPIYLTPKYNGKSWKGLEVVGDNAKEWSSFEEYSKNILKNRDELQRDDRYKNYLSDISEIKNGLNEITSKINTAREAFYNTLADEIVEYYNSISKENRTRELLSDLRSSRTNFEEEFRENKNINECARQFNSDVYNNENEKNK